ncbi:phosphatidylinositol-glycan biosynthesis class F protein isoform X2 [Hyalella azteca]|uniref:Phosphatidylinositol-glycan biosynthesis class F protein isoform X2 n=1 Tax=Hyalella azteca TaxID=294128 RepID=A0A8B7PHH7_HYAAZ|nr:phosphatidylinositol-glycan biosynthesis class F protein isoform X2 [Hyalella azteca]
MGGSSSTALVKYLLSCLTSLGCCLYLFFNALDIHVCLSAIQISTLIFSIIEVAFVYSSGSNEILQLDKHNLWKVRGILWSIAQLLCCLLAIHGVILLFGAPILHGVVETFSLSLLLTVLCCGRAFVSLGPNALNCLLTARRIGGVSEGEVRAVLVLLGAWLGALPIPLDWDRPWQTWPLTCTIGSLLGEACANVYLLRYCGDKQQLLH